MRWSLSALFRGLVACLTLPSMSTSAWQAPSTTVASLGASGMPARPSDAASLPPVRPP